MAMSARPQFGEGLSLTTWVLGKPTGGHLQWPASPAAPADMSIRQLRGESCPMRTACQWRADDPHTKPQSASAVEPSLGPCKHPRTLQKIVHALADGLAVFAYCNAHQFTMVIPPNRRPHRATWAPQTGAYRTTRKMKTRLTRIGEKRIPSCPVIQSEGGRIGGCVHREVHHLRTEGKGGCSSDSQAFSWRCLHAQKPKSAIHSMEPA